MAKRWSHRPGTRHPEAADLGNVQGMPKAPLRYSAGRALGSYLQRGRAWPERGLNLATFALRHWASWRSSTHQTENTPGANVVRVTTVVAYRRLRDHPCRQRPWSSPPLPVGPQHPGVDEIESRCAAWQSLRASYRALQGGLQAGSLSARKPQR